MNRLQQTDINQISNKDKQCCFNLITEAWMNELAEWLQEVFVKFKCSLLVGHGVEGGGGPCKGDAEASDILRHPVQSPPELEAHQENFRLDFVLWGQQYILCSSPRG